MYRRGDLYKTKQGRTYFFINHPGVAEGSFTRAIETYCNALINSNGGILVFGVDYREKMVGFELTRSREDTYKLCFDGVIKTMRPTIHPHQYRLDVIYLQDPRVYPVALFEIRMSAGDPEEIYENSRREMYIVKEKQLYGPLFPCEITQIVLAKYKEELSCLIIENNQRQITADIHAEQRQQEEKRVMTSEEKESKSGTTHNHKVCKWDKVTWP